MERLESQRAQLEQNISRLRAALQHWKAWDLKYEEFKEDALGLGECTVPNQTVKNDHAPRTDFFSDFTRKTLKGIRESIRLMATSY